MGIYRALNGMRFVDARKKIKPFIKPPSEYKGEIIF